MHPKVFPFALHCSCFVSLFAIFLLIVVDIISLFIVALAMALARVAALEAELKTATKAIKDTNTAKVSAEKVAKEAEPRLRRLKKLWLRLIRNKPSRNKLWLSDLTRFPHLLAVSPSSCP
jgi:hypothetical protein